jgi:hypothetical protein
MEKTLQMAPNWMKWNNIVIVNIQCRSYLQQGLALPFNMHLSFEDNIFVNFNISEWSKNSYSY